MNLKLSKESREWLKSNKRICGGKISLDKASEIAGVSKRKFTIMLKDSGISLNVSSEDFIKGLDP